jgi:hypothetical protein
MVGQWHLINRWSLIQRCKNHLCPRPTIRIRTQSTTGTSTPLPHHQWADEHSIRHCFLNHKKNSYAKRIKSTIMWKTSSSRWKDKPSAGIISVPVMVKMGSNQYKSSSNARLTCKVLLVFKLNDGLNFSFFCHSLHHDQQLLLACIIIDTKSYFGTRR